ncbi:MAG TPA: hypothetical protein VM261_32160 [Kofleriaceae bacterium]|nr:hypothetical protein [Kofleriaceae bacterium]
MRRFGVVLLGALAACGGGAKPAPGPPSSRAPELATAAPECDDATLRAFDPGLPGLERGVVERRDAPAEPLAREHARPCELAEDDELCQARARRAVLAADPTASISGVSMDGEPDGWQAQLDVDGLRQAVVLPEGAEVLDEVRRLRSLGHRVVPLEGRRVFREGSRRAIVQYAVVVDRAPARMRWEATLRWPQPADVENALGQLQHETERANLVNVSYEVTAAGLVAVVACP